MKKMLSLLLAFSLLLAACQTEEVTAPPVEEVPVESIPKEEVVKEEFHLFRTTGVEPVRFEISGTVENSTERYVRELTAPKYQGRAGGSEGNRLAADWIVEQFEAVGLQQLPSLGDWKQNYSTVTTEVLDGEAYLLAPDGTKTELILGEDWIFRASPDVVDGVFTLTTDEAMYDDGNGIWDAYAEPKNAGKKLCLTIGEVEKGFNYSNPTVIPSRLIVEESVYEQLKQEGYRLDLKLPDAVDEEGNADNVVGYLPGKDSTKAVVLGADFNGPGQCGSLLMPGAYNNASGVATLIQTAEWLAQVEELPCDVIFIAFNVNGVDRMEEHIAEQYGQIRMVSLKCIGWKGQPMTIYGLDSDATLRNSLAGGMELQYVNEVGRSIFSSGDSVSSVSLFQDACLNDEEASAVLNSTRDVADNLDFAVLDETAKRLAEWVAERGDEPLKAYVVYW